MPGVDRLQLRQAVRRRRVLDAALPPREHAPQLQRHRGVPGEGGRGRRTPLLLPPAGLLVRAGHRREVPRGHVRLQRAAAARASASAQRALLGVLSDLHQPDVRGVHRGVHPRDGALRPLPVEEVALPAARVVPGGSARGRRRERPGQAGAHPPAVEAGKVHDSAGCVQAGGAQGRPGGGRLPGQRHGKQAACHPGPLRRGEDHAPRHSRRPLHGRHRRRGGAAQRPQGRALGPPPALRVRHAGRRAAGDFHGVGVHAVPRGPEDAARDGGAGAAAACTGGGGAAGARQGGARLHRGRIEERDFRGREKACQHRH